MLKTSDDDDKQVKEIITEMTNIIIVTITIQTSLYLSEVLKPCGNDKLFKH
jgi:hypothetical protein